MTVVTARSVALEVVRRVIDEGAYSNRLVPALLARSGLDPRDRAFATELAFGTLRRRLLLDAAISRAADRPVDRITPPVAAHALRLGAYQLLDAGVPPHAAVSETVDLVPGRPRGFVNAVLRSIASRPAAVPSGGDANAIAARTGVARWIVDELRALVGDEAESAAGAFAARAPLSLRVVDGDVESVLRDLHAAGFDARHGEVESRCVVVDGGDPRTMPGFVEGRWAVQDQASAFVTAVLDPQEGDHVYDACAAPGGKTLDAAARVGSAGSVVATDVAMNRLALIRASAERLHRSPWLVAHDAARPALAGPFDRALVDAPCTGIGSARRRPELLWRPKRDRVGALAARQLAIVKATAELVRAGGTLVYSVCTFTRAETDAVCDAVLRARPDLTAITTDGPDGPAQRHRLWPHRHGTDGMFVAAFRRTA